MPNAEQRVETPLIQQAETRGEPYPNTTLGVLRRLKELALENNLVGIQTENGIVVSKLLEIVEDGIEILKDGQRILASLGKEKYHILTCHESKMEQLSGQEKDSKLEKKVF